MEGLTFDPLELGYSPSPSFFLIWVKQKAARGRLDQWDLDVPLVEPVSRSIMD